MTKIDLPAVKFNFSAYLAEFLGTFVFVLVSLGAIILNNTVTEIGILGVALAAGLAYTAMVFATMHLSGGHLNPVITLSMWFAKRITSVDLCLYVLSQCLASFAATFALVYIFAINLVGLAIAFQFAGVDVTLQRMVVVEAIFGAILVFSYFATMVDRRGPASFGPIVVGLVVLVAALVAAPVSGGFINPARVIGPAVISNSYSELLAWIVGPLSGSLFGFVYDFVFSPKRK